MTQTKNGARKSTDIQTDIPVRWCNRVKYDGNKVKCVHKSIEANDGDLQTLVLAEGTNCLQCPIYPASGTGSHVFALQDTVVLMLQLKRLAAAFIRVVTTHYTRRPH